MITHTSTPDALDDCRLVTVQQLSQLLCVSVRSCWRLEALAQAGQAGGFPKAVTVGPKLRRWRLEDVRDYLDGLRKGGRP